MPLAYLQDEEATASGEGERTKERVGVAGHRTFYLHEQLA